MKRFLVTYHGPGAPPNMDPDTIAKVKAAFMEWLEQAGGAVEDPGAATHTVGHVANGAAHAAEVSGYSILKTASLQDAKAVLAKHPFVQRGGTLQISEIIKM